MVVVQTCIGEGVGVDGSLKEDLIGRQLAAI